MVIKDVPDYSLVYGIPAKQQGWFCECGFKLGDNLVCSNCNIKYKLKASQINKEIKLYERSV